MSPEPAILIRRWLEHRDETAARALMDQLYPLVARIVRRHATGRDSPEDLCQEAFSRLFAQLHRFDPRQPLENWTARLTLNVCRNHWRHQARRPELHWEDLSPTEQNLAEHLWNADPPSSADLPPDDAHHLLLKILETLPADDRLVLTLLHLDDKSTEDIASLTGWSRTLVKVRAHRARAKLRRALAHLKP
jgi:RNA polymerase sigma-70 factor (ECF subfamily)